MTEFEITHVTSETGAIAANYCSPWRLLNCTILCKFIQALHSIFALFAATPPPPEILDDFSMHLLSLCWWGLWQPFACLVMVSALAIWQVDSCVTVLCAATKHSIPGPRSHESISNFIAGRWFWYCCMNLCILYCGAGFVHVPTLDSRRKTQHVNTRVVPAARSAPWVAVIWRWKPLTRHFLVAAWHVCSILDTRLNAFPRKSCILRHGLSDGSSIIAHWPVLVKLPWLQRGNTMPSRTTPVLCCMAWTWTWAWQCECKNVRIK